MAYKLGLMLSMVFLMSVMLLGGDIIAVSSIHSSLDALALVVARGIGQEGYVSEATEALLEEHRVDLKYQESHFPALGETLTFTLARLYSSLVISKDAMVISVKRTAIVGYYMNGGRG